MNLIFNSHQRGFTLIEVIMVTAIVSVALLMIARVFPIGMRAKESAEQYSVAALLGQQLLEELKKKGYGALSSVYPSELPDHGVGEGSFKLHRGYRWRVEWWDTEIPNLRKVRVRIFYDRSRVTDRGTYQPHMDLVTYLAKRD